MKSLAVFVPYRDSDELEALRREVTGLRAELTALRGEELYPFSASTDPCRKCGGFSGSKVDWSQYPSRDVPTGPSRFYQPAKKGVRRHWWSRRCEPGTPERFQLGCGNCNASYYERTKT